MRLRKSIAAVIVIVAAVALLVVTPLPRGRSPLLAKASSATPAPRAPEATDRSLPAGSHLLFIGASYSIGLGATSPLDALPRLLSRDLHASFRVDAIAGTGFQNPGRKGLGTFAQRIRTDAATPSPQAVLIQGGRNDLHYPLSREFDAVLATIRLARARFAQARIVLLGPVPARVPVSRRMSRLCNSIARAAAAGRASFINPVAEHWITEANEHRYIGNIPGHPNDAGYRYIARRLLDALPTALAASAPPASGAHVKRDDPQSRDTRHA
jgi:lysophospholipase L1-like esterase